MTEFKGTNTSPTLMGYISQMDNKLSDRSKREYTSRLKEISKKIRRDGDTLTPDMLLAHLNKMVTDNRIADSTFRINKASVMYWIGQQAQAVIASGGDPSDYARAYLALRALKYSQIAAAADRTSGKKLKFFTQESFDALSKYAVERGHRAPNAIRAAAFAKANLLVGLRPSEWFDATFAYRLEVNEQGEFVKDVQNRIKFENMLIVENAKATHGRGNGQRRELILHGVTAAELTALVYFQDMARSFKERHPAGTEAKKLTNLFYRPMNNMIRRALIASGFAERDIPSIYSTRHQVVADFKSSGVSAREIAAFFGHSSNYTHKEHYGHKRHGGRAVTFRASPECLARVTTGNNLTKQRETIPEQLVADIESWVTERDARKGPAGQ